MLSESIQTPESPLLSSKSRMASARLPSTFTIRVSRGCKQLGALSLNYQISSGIAFARKQPKAA